MIDYKETAEDLSFAVRVIPRASKNEIVGELDGAVKIRIKAPPIDGAANAELIAFLAKELKVPKRSIDVASGASSRSKTIRISGLSRESALKVKSRLQS